MRLRTILLGFCALLLVLSAAVSFNGFYLASKFKAASVASEVNLAAMRNHMTADMMHDSLVGSVYEAMYGIDDPEKMKAVQSGFAEKVQTFRSSIDANRALALPDATASAINGVKGPLDSYITTAEAIIGLAAAGKKEEAAAKLPGFDAAFGQLEDAMASVSDQIEIGNKAASEESKWIASFASMANWATLALETGLCAFVLFFGSRAVSGPLTRMTAGMKQLAGGNLTVAIERKRTVTEVAEMADALAVFRDTAIAKAELDEREASAAAIRRSRREKIEAMIATFNRDADGLVDSVVTTTGEMSKVAGELEAMASGANAKARAAMHASSETSANVSQVSAAATQLDASIDEITKRIADAGTVVSSAEARAAAANGEITKLNDMANRIGSVVGLIRDIAEQTNLLALNATIEAARAGESGKGFAVVASEVKQLATQTAKATDEIATQISAVQAGTGSVVDALRQISASVAEASSLTQSIAETIREQAAATSEIARTITSTAEASADVDQNVAGVGESISVTASSAMRMRDMANSVSSRNNELKTCVKTFLQDVAAA